MSNTQNINNPPKTELDKKIKELKHEVDVFIRKVIFIYKRLQIKKGKK